MTTPAPAVVVPAPRTSGRLVGYELAARRLVPPLLGVICFAFTVWAVVVALGREAIGIDFHHVYWPAARAVLHGHTPYVDAQAPIVAEGGAFVYPAPAALFFAPFGLLPHGVADVMFTALTIAAVAGTLWLLGVRDWRAYGTALLWPSVFGGWQTANLTLLLCLAVAAAWRYRNDAVMAGILVGLAVSLKLFLWPLAIWLLASRRYRAAGCAALTAGVVNLVSWLVVGLHEIPRYTDLVRALTHEEERQAYSVMSYAMHQGVGRTAAYGLGFLLATAVGAIAVVLGRRGRESACLTVTLAVCLLASPLVWLHYFSLLLIPVAIARPRFSALWALPLVLWVCPPDEPLGWQLVLALAVAAGLVVGSIRAPGGPEMATP